jgi:hypothetical protein
MRWMVVALVVAGCAASKDEQRAIDEYIERHAMTMPEKERFRRREVAAGDPLDRVQIAWQGCNFDLQQTDPKLAIYSISVPIGVKPVYVSDPMSSTREIQIVEAGSVLLTFQEGKLLRWVIVNRGNLNPLDH